MPEVGALALQPCEPLHRVSWNGYVVELLRTPKGARVV
jgi:hypothetical protein